MGVENENHEKRGMTRRSFVKGGAAVAVTLAAGGLIVGCDKDEDTPQSKEKDTTSDRTENRWSFETPPEPIKESDIKKTIKSDVVIVGAGIAGLCSALSAAEAGAKVVVIEKNEAYSVRGMHIAAINTKVQERKNVEVDYIQGIRDIIGWSAGEVKQDLWWLWAEHCGPSFNWVLDMCEEEGITADLWAANYKGKDFYEYPGVTHIFTGPSHAKYDSNRDFMEVINKKAQEKNVEFHYKTEALQLIRPDEDRVTSVIGQGSDGDYIKFEAKNGIILCCGDYGADEELIERYCPQAKNVDGNVYTPVGANTGDGHKMGLWAGAAMQKSEPHPAMVHTQLGANTYCFLHVNKKGVRYSNEDATPQLVCNTKTMQPDNLAWVIYDDKFLDEIPKTIETGGGLFWDQVGRLWDEEWSREGEEASIKRQLDAGHLVKADTIEDLAEKIQVPADKLVATVKRYNELVKKGYDEDFHKNPKLLFPIEKPPFYAGIFRSALLVTLGGLSVNEKMQVLDSEDNPIPGLYAAGNNAGDFFAKDYPTIFPGASVSRAIVFGRLAGQIAAAGD